MDDIYSNQRQRSEAFKDKGQRPTQRRVWLLTIFILSRINYIVAGTKPKMDYDGQTLISVAEEMA